MAMTTPTDSGNGGLHGGGAQPQDIASVSIRLPEFWPADPLVWFAQVEVQFATHRITSEVAKFNYVLLALPPPTAIEVRDIILQRPKENPYDKLKMALINRTSETERRRLQQLLSAEYIGDRKPTQLLRRMQQLLDDKAGSFDGTFLRELFLKRLPSSVQMILASAEGSSLDALARMADNITDVASPTIAAVASLPDPILAISKNVADLRADVARLHQMLQDLTTRRACQR
ncbi:uncharacterized protein LOC135376811 [Ornithodoros turicata]|uniref:uncharacterized protein LOC135376811 n=1 Tax=Ornithodoros turicata TaxID=34597 RepID=UPI0031390906